MAYSGQVLSSFQSVSERLDVLVRGEVRCVVVEGPGGCGKTALLRGLAARHGRRPGERLLYLHLGEQVDGKTLLGTFSSTGSPGQFKWEQGVLAKAVESGSWVILEDIDSAPADVVSLLLPLVKSGHLLLPGRLEPLTAGAGFMMFLTRKSDVGGKPSAICQVLCQHCAILRLQAMTTKQQVQIISRQYPSLSSLGESLVEKCSSEKMHFRKVLKLCGRVHPQIYNGQITSITDFMLEVIDCLGGHLPLSERTKMAGQWTHLCGGMSSDKVTALCSSHKPSVTLSPSVVTVGRSFLPRVSNSPLPSRLFVHTRSSLCLLEQVCACVARSEPVLLVGETGVGKTATISYLAQLAGVKLVVMNMSQQTDSTDLLGGYKPIHLSQVLAPVRDEFERLFLASYSGKKNKRFLEEIQLSLANQSWKKFLDLMLTSVKSALVKPSLVKPSSKSKQNQRLMEDWKKLRGKIKKLRSDLQKPRSSLAFSFVEGALVESVRHGHWILLDEINLATPETLQCLSSLLESPTDSFVIPEKPECPAVARHGDFRLFCCMNPATDVGKKQLPGCLRNRFTELYVDEVQSEADLQLLVRSYLHYTQPSNLLISNIIKLYQSIRQMADTTLEDGIGRRPHYSLRSLCRALTYADSNPCNNFSRSLYEGFCLTLLSELSPWQHDTVKTHIRTCLQLSEKALAFCPPDPSSKGQRYRKVGSFWLKCYSPVYPVPDDSYIVTESVQKNLDNLARAISARGHPVLLQGPTSAGKTSCIQYVAGVLGQECLRINNHEHTDLQEYVGSYTSSHNGQLVFQEGVLVTAMRKGQWIILDELNLAPTEVLEALNRVLDDNRELFISETQELVKASPNFMLFGTQNPPGAYGGRKVLSRAFRNRFIELHFEDIPSGELVEILHRRCQLPQSYASKMVAVMKDLQERRSMSGIFAGKYGLITLRDLFRWAERYRRSNSLTQFHDWDQQLAEDGYMLLSGRLRVCQDQGVVQEVIQKHFKRPLDPRELFGVDGGGGSVASRACVSALRATLPAAFSHLVWTEELLKVAVLLYRCLQFDEPVLLVGNTGCGKTSLCQLVSVLKDLQFLSINCHLHTEAADFLGGLRPLRQHLPQDEQADVSDKVEADPGALFEWVDGVVVKAMKEGGCLMVDEISLADDAVLERLNSVLEPERKLVVSEKNRTHKGEVFQITAAEGFQFLATMNPGGDYGKKELSPALRNRFVEIWCSSSSSRDSYGQILRHNLDSTYTHPGDDGWVELMLDVLDWIKSYPSVMVSVRDLLTWVQFMNVTKTTLSPPEAFYQGAHLVFLDALGCGSQGVGSRLKEGLEGFIKEQLLLKDSCGRGKCAKLRRVGEFVVEKSRCGIRPFTVTRGLNQEKAFPYSLEAPGPKQNIFRLLRAMQLRRPLLLEGAPGVGKTSLVMALARFSGHNIVRINLSEQTDISDLFGADLPVEGKGGGHFEWRDGPFLKALKNGDWVVFDEMNLASQSVLEGLNACLDHRGEVYVPELAMSFQVSCETKIFACQNPLHQGGGRKGLPKSFLNRFTQVYVDALSEADLLTIASSMHPTMSLSILERMIKFTLEVSKTVEVEAFSWEFNLRDVFRWCELMLKYQTESSWDPGQFVQMLYCSRLRDQQSRELISRSFEEVFEGTRYTSVASLGTSFNISQQQLKVGEVVLDVGFYQEQDIKRWNRQYILHCQLPVMEAILTCVEMNWMAILVGPPCSGKGCLVKNLAAMASQRLLEFPMNSNTDTIDLLGGYEQVDVDRRFRNILCQMKDVSMYFGVRGNLDKLCPDLLEVVQLFMALSFTVEHKDHDVELMEDVLDAVLMLERFFPNLPYNLKYFAEEISSLLKCMGGASENHQFEWVDSVLVKALEYGHWLLISHANFCSPSVLDRLNALLEPGGVLRMDERGLVGDSVKVVKPHPNFRLFLTMDPSHGEISRAMRNRGVEIFLLPQDIPANGGFPEDSLSLLEELSVIKRKLSWSVVQSLNGTCNPVQLKLFGSIVTSMWEEVEKDKSKCWDIAAALAGLKLDGKGDEEDMPPLLEFHGSVTTLGMLLQENSTSQAFLTMKELLPAIKEIKTASSHASSGLLLSRPMLTSHLLVFISCSSAICNHPRLLMLQQAGVMAQGAVRAEVEGWGHALRQFWEKSNSAEHERIIQQTSWSSLPTSLVLCYFRVLGLSNLLEKHLQLASSSSQYDSVIALSSRVHKGTCPVERLGHPSLCYLHQCLTSVLSFLKDYFSKSEEVFCVVDWLMAFISMVWETDVDFSVIVCAWNLLRKNGLQILKDTKRCRGKKLLAVLDRLQPLEDIMSKNDAYVALRQHVGAPAPSSEESMQLKAVLCQQDEEIARRGSLESWMLSDDLFAHRQKLMHVLVNVLNQGNSDPQLTSGLPGVGQTQEKLSALAVGVLQWRHQVLLAPAVACFRSLLLDGHNWSVPDWNTVVQYLLRVPGFPVAELEPLFREQLRLEEARIMSVTSMESLFGGLGSLCSTPQFQSSLIGIDQSVLSSVSFGYFCPWSVEDAEVCPEQKSLSALLTLDNFQEKQRELRQFLQLLWLHGSAGVYSLSYLSEEMVLLKRLGEQIIQCINGVLQDTSVDWRASISSISIKVIKDLCQRAQSALPNYASWDVIESSLHRAISSLEDAESLCVESSMACEFESLIRLGMAKCYFGITLCQLFSPAPVDPTVTATTEHKCYQKQLLHISSLIEAWQLHFLLLTGRRFTDLYAADRMPDVLSFLLKRREDLTSMMKELPALPVSRTNGAKYSELVQIARVLVSSLCSEASIGILLSEVGAAPKDGIAWSKVATWTKAVGASLRKIKSEFSSFPDVVAPFSAGLTLVLNGVNTVSLVRQFRTEGKERVAETILQLSAFPVQCDLHEPLKYIKDVHEWSTWENVFDGLGDRDFKKNLKTLAMSHVTEHVQSVPCVRQCQLPVLEELLDHWWSLWSASEAESRAKELEDQSLYRYRSKTHIIQESEEEVSESQLQEMFPVYKEWTEEEDEMSVDKEEKEGDGQGEEEGDIEGSSEATRVGCLKFSSEELQLVVNIHLKLHAINSEDLLMKNSKDISYEMGSNLTRLMERIPGLKFDGSLLSSHMLKCRSLLASASLSLPKNYNVYRDPAPSENVRACEVTKNLQSCMKDLLVEWPDNPTLLQITRGCERLMELDLQSPVMKTLAGLEYILKKAQDWEAYASRHVSILPQLEAITHLVLEWRKKELNSWKKFLEASKEEAVLGSCKWWFHLYGLCQDHKSCTEDNIGNFVGSLHQFMESSTLVEFKSRLLLLDAFYKDMIHRGHKVLAHPLGNVYMFYKQFTEAVDKSQQDLVAPVEKEFSEQLSILHWNDGSYWSVKASTEKSHRMILRLVTKHKEILHQPVKPVLTDSNLASVSDEGHSEESSLGDILDKLSKTILTRPADVGVEQSVLQLIVLGAGISTPVACERLVGYVEDYCRTSVCHSCSREVDELTSAAIEALNDLQSEAYLKGLDSGKRKAAIKLRSTQKRNALTDLFRRLKQEGLSYRKTAGADDLHVSAFIIPSLQHLHMSQSSEAMNALWDKAQWYYYRCLARMATFHLAFHSPSKDLTLGQIGRCQGYAGQLMALVSSQRKLLSDELQAADKLKNISTQMKALVSSNCHCVVSEDYKKWLMSLGNCAELGLKTIQDFKLLVSTFPDEVDFSLTPFPQERLPRILRCGDKSMVDKAVGLLENHSAQLMEICRKCFGLENDIECSGLSFVASTQVGELSSGFEAITRYLASLSDVVSLLDGMSARDGLFSFLNVFHKRASEEVCKYSSWLQSCEVRTSTSSGTEVAALVADGAQGIFLSVQRLMLDYKSILNQKNEDPENFPNIKSLKNFTVQTLSTLKSSWVLEATSKLLTLLPSALMKESQFARGWLSVLDQYMLLHDQVLRELLVSHYAMGKLLSVLLKTFTTLVTKGFCTPLEEAVSKDNDSTEFVDIEAGGFDEGQGESNVSQSAEKDNLDGGGGKEEKQDKEDGSGKDDEEDAVEMDEDFDGDIKDMPKKEADSSEDKSDEEVEDEEDKQMGQLGGDQPEELDRNMWAEEEEKENEKAGDPLEKESGGGSAEDEEMKMVAKDDNAGLADKEEKKQKEESQEEHCPMDEVVDYEQPAEEIDSQKNENLDFGEDLQLDDIASDSELEGSGDAESVANSELMEDSEGNGSECEEGGKPELEESNENEDISNDDNVWSKDQITQDGVEPSTNDSLMGNSNLPANEENCESREDAEGKSDVQINDEGTGSQQDSQDNSNTTQSEVNDQDKVKQKEKASQGAGSDGVQDQEMREEQSEHTAAKRPNLPSLNDRTLACEEDEVLVKRPKLMEADEAMAVDNSDVPSSSEISNTYQHIGGGSCRHDAVLWDIGQSEQTTGPHDIPPQPESQEPEGEKPVVDSSALLKEVPEKEVETMEGALDRWFEYERSTFTLSQLLYEELRLILLPTKASQLKGDFRTGKRLNMRRIIPYIASNFQNDRIWLRRSKPSQREYQILLAVDDSSSMNENKCMQMAYESLALVSNALNKLEAGQLGVCRFGESVEVLHPLDRPFTSASGALVLKNMSFSQSRTNFVQMLTRAGAIFGDSKRSKTSHSAATIDQLLLILSDGRGVFADGSQPLLQSIRKLNEMNIFCVFIILDSLYKDSVTDIKVPTFTAGKPLQLKTYLETFPFNFYIVLREVKMLPHILGQALRQWFEMVAVHSAS